MTTVTESEPRIQEIRIGKDEIVATLVDGRVISVPLAWSWRLCEATPKQRANFRVIGTGQGVHWPDIDEDISVEGMLRGTPAPRSTPAIELPDDRSRHVPRRAGHPGRAARVLAVPAARRKGARG